MKRLLVVLAMALVLAVVAAPVWAQQLTGGCSAFGDSGVDQTNVVDATRSNPFEIDPEGSVSYRATSPGPIKNHTWEVWVDVGGFRITIADGGDPNDDEDTETAGVESVPENIDEVESNPLVGELIGIYLVGGSIAGEGGECSGNAYVLIPGNPLGSTAGKVGAGLAVLGFVGFAAAGFAKRP